MNSDIRTVCDSNLCTGCKACENVCRKNAVEVRDNLDSYSAVIDSSKCVDCGLCSKVCPNISPRELHEPFYWAQGWTEPDIRKNSSSGGAASELIRTFIEMGGYVASCLFENGDIRFVLTNDLERAKKFAGSKYVKSNPGNIYNEVNECLKKGEKVLFIGLPCQSAALQNICKDNKNLYTADLICHGTPSKKILDSYLKDKGIDINSIKDLKFRDNNSFGLIVDGRRLAPKKAPDNYIWAFLKCSDYTENCYHCRYATSERVSDITLGDAWGQLSDTDEDGVSLVLCQTDKGRYLYGRAMMYSTDVDIVKAKNSNPQLNYPTGKPAEREVLMSKLKEGGSLDAAVKKAYPKQSLKKAVKTILIKMSIIKDN